VVSLGAKPSRRLHVHARRRRANGPVPYAAIEIESPALAEATTGFITHKLDFQHLWQAFNVRGVADDEEVIVIWNRSALKGIARWRSRNMPAS
jgi:hypothetical protein